MDLAVSIILIVLFIISLVKLIIYHHKRRDLYKAGNKIPGPKPVLPIIGNSHLFMGNSDNNFNKIMLLLSNYKSSPVRVWFGQDLFIYLFDPDQIKVSL